jgi:hypothetical protein
LCLEKKYISEEKKTYDKPHKTCAVPLGSVRCVWEFYVAVESWI